VQRQMIGWPAHAKTRRLRTWKRFFQQMVDAEKVFKGPNTLVQAPGRGTRPRRLRRLLAIACALTLDLVMPTVEVSNSPFFAC
jgi:site-specific recombinase XerC